MEVPAPRDGKISEIIVKVGDSVSEGDDMLKMVADAAAGESTVAAEEAPVPAAQPESAPVPAAPAPVAASSIQEVTVPDIGAENVPVIEICVTVGDEISEEDSLIVLESDKASMDVPSPFAGVIKEICVKEGDKLSQGDLVVKVETTGGLHLFQHLRLPPRPLLHHRLQLPLLRRPKRQNRPHHFCSETGRTGRNQS